MKLVQILSLPLFFWCRISGEIAERSIPSPFRREGEKKIPLFHFVGCVGVVFCVHDFVVDRGACVFLSLILYVYVGPICR